MNSPLNVNPAALKVADSGSRARPEVRPRANSEPRPMVRTAVTKKVQEVERSERILVHSERATPTMPGRCSGFTVDTKTGEVVVVLTGPQPSWSPLRVRPALAWGGSGPGRGTRHRPRSGSLDRMVPLEKSRRTSGAEQCRQVRRLAVERLTGDMLEQVCAAVVAAHTCSSMSPV